MTEIFWTPEKKQDYLDLDDQRSSRREYMREYMKKARDTGKYRYFRDNGKVKFEKGNYYDEKKENKTKSK